MVSALTTCAAKDVTLNPATAMVREVEFFIKVSISKTRFVGPASIRTSTISGFFTPTRREQTESRTGIRGHMVEFRLYTLVCTSR